LVVFETLHTYSTSTSGLIITFFQFVFTAACAYLTQCDPTQAYTVRKPRIPIQRWVFVAALFYSINMLNNWAFAYKISVPVHIILRSFGSVTTMIAGALRGKRYSFLQVMSVIMLTVGVLVSAWADSEGKVSAPVRRIRRASSTSRSSFHGNALHKSLHY
jgi:UDP-xylose/UDP-N-acetylglucosamine transporter B4